MMYNDAFGGDEEVMSIEEGTLQAYGNFLKNASVTASLTEASKWMDMAERVMAGLAIMGELYGEK